MINRERILKSHNNLEDNGRLKIQINGQII